MQYKCDFLQKNDCFSSTRLPGARDQPLAEDGVHDALAFLEIEASDKYYNESEAIDKTSNVEFTIAEDKYDDWREKRNVRIINNARMEGLHDAIKEAVQNLTSALGAVEDYR